MESVVHCDCGFEARAADEEELVAEVQRHALEEHGMALTRHEALLLVFRAGLDETAPQTPSRADNSNEGGGAVKRQLLHTDRRSS